ncbi:MAG: DUF2339 domain-containing protein [Deltaproteobacteria bacterium]|nr:DUF2339 domain-containing protein [Deltaproteobacteria bacterium]
MEEVLAAIGLILLALIILVMPIIALVFAIKARNSIKNINNNIKLRIESIENELQRLKQNINKTTNAKKTIVEQTIANTDTFESISNNNQQTDAKSINTIDTSTIANNTEPENITNAAYIAKAPSFDSPETEIKETTEKSTINTPPSSLEETIGLVWFTRIGAIIGLVVVAWFFKYAVDNDWIGPWGRVGIGATLGAALLFSGAFLARRSKHIHGYFLQGLMGLGLAILVVSGYASFGFYHLLAAWEAFAVITLLCVVGGALAYTFNSQLLLSLSLIAAFLNPVMLSTGVDRPFALFSYLLLMTSGAIFVAIVRRYTIALALAVFGIIAIFIGWYDRFFNISPPPLPGTVDELPEKLQGAYYPLLARFAPLIFTALFALEWSIAGILLRKRGRPIVALVFYLIAAVSAHAAYTGLLFDHTFILGGILCALAAIFASLLIYEGHGNWLGLPMVVAFTVLAAVANDVAIDSRLPIMLLTGGLSAIYFGIILRTSLRSGSLASWRALLLIGGAGLGLLVLAVQQLLIHHHIETFAGLVAVLSLIYLLIAISTQRITLLIVVLIVSFISFGVASSINNETNYVFLGICSLWFLMHLGFLAFEMLFKQRPWNFARLAALGGVGVCYIFLLLSNTANDADLLRACVSIATGALYLIFGVRMLNAGRYAQDRVLLPLGLAVTLFTLALAFLLSGPSLTVAWAIEAGALGWLATKAKRNEQLGHSAWLIFALVMILLALIRLLGWDWDWAQRQYWIFISTQGEKGILQPSPFLHPRAWGLIAIGVALLLCAKCWSRLRENFVFRITALITLIAGHIAVLVLLITEIQIWATVAPPQLLAKLPREEFDVILQNWQNAVWAQSTRLSMITTIIMAIYALLLLSFGFAIKDYVHRLLGIALFAITLGKLTILDVWRLETIYRIAVGATLATLFLVGGFLYARFAKRVRTLIMDGSNKSALLFFICVSLATANAFAQKSNQQDNTAPSNIKAAQLSQSIVNIPIAGDYKITITPALYAASKTQPTLQDLRIIAPDGNNAPYFIEDVRPPAPQNRATARLLNPVILPNGATQVVLAIPKSAREHNAVFLDIKGNNYLRATKVESSLNGKSFGLLAQGEYVFMVSNSRNTASRNYINYPLTHARYLRITVLPGQDQQALHINGAIVHHEIINSHLKAYAQVTLGISSEENINNTYDKKSIYLFEKLPSNLPIHALELEVAPDNFVRRAYIEATTKKQAWFPVGGGIIYQVLTNENKPTVYKNALNLTINPGSRPYIRLIIENGDDPPIKVLSAKLHYQRQEIIMRAKEVGDYILRLGDAKAKAPSYDLREQLRRTGFTELPQITIGPLQLVTINTDDQSQTTKIAFSEKYALFIKIGLGVLAIILLIWTIRMIKRPSRV